MLLIVVRLFFLLNWGRFAANCIVMNDGTFLRRHPHFSACPAAMERNSGFLFTGIRMSEVIQNNLAGLKRGGEEDYNTLTW